MPSRPPPRGHTGYAIDYKGHWIGAGGYAQCSYNLTAYAGLRVTLRFTGTENASRQTSFVIDDTALNVS